MVLLQHYLARFNLADPGFLQVIQ
uniref:Uncharacterized protein n=1 Tax=Anguilla anguilla TaxID=7936 RepID=A0A0E9T020_ANGAN